MSYNVAKTRSLTSEFYLFTSFCYAQNFILIFFTQHYHFKDNFKQNVHQCIRVLSTTALQLKNQFGYRAKS